MPLLDGKIIIHPTLRTSSNRQFFFATKSLQEYLLTNILFQIELMILQKLELEASGWLPERFLSGFKILIISIRSQDLCIL